MATLRKPLVQLTGELSELPPGDALEHTTIGARVYNSAAIPTTSGVALTLTFNSERYDTDAIHDAVSNTSRLTCKTAGKYSIEGAIEFANNVNGFRQIYILLNGATALANSTQNSIAGAHSMTIGTTYDLAVNDYVELFVVQNCGVALNVQASPSYSPIFMMHRIGA